MGAQRFVLGCTGAGGDRKQGQLASPMQGPRDRWSSWGTTLDGNGVGQQDVSSENITDPMKPLYTTRVSKLQVTPRQMLQLAESVEENDFFSLDKGYKAEVTDSVGITLGISLRGRTHFVFVYAPHSCKQRGHVARFCRIWGTLLTLVPSPNSKDTPDYWLNVRFMDD